MTAHTKIYYVIKDRSILVKVNFIQKTNLIIISYDVKLSIVCRSVLLAVHCFCSEVYLVDGLLLTFSVMLY
jgi:hypothetical protein